MLNRWQDSSGQGVAKKREKNGGQWIGAQRHKESSDRLFREWVRVLLGRDYSSHSVGEEYGVARKEGERKQS